MKGQRRSRVAHDEDSAAAMYRFEADASKDGRVYPTCKNTQYGSTHPSEIIVGADITLATERAWCYHMESGKFHSIPCTSQMQTLSYMPNPGTCAQICPDWPLAQIICAFAAEPGATDHTKAAGNLQIEPMRHRDLNSPHSEQISWPSCAFP